jgi:UDP-N-acetylglucosamine--N-acetylmuramyl-(pentapeptide) pyrophosphoryl-undecaprenol N-acetylglucosamine transferase
MRIVLTGGGTGGHLFPLIAVERKMKEKLGPEGNFLYIGSGAQMEKDVMSKEGIPMKFVMSGKMRRYFSMQNVVDFFKVPVGFVQALWILLRYMPDVVFSKGGFVAIPTVLAAWVYRIPVLIHESDAIPGVANRFLSNFASRIAVAYPLAEDYLPQERTALVGNPLREDVTGGDAAMLRKKLEFTESKKTIFVIGGSQGSQVINKAIIRILPALLKHFQVIHQTGEKNYDECMVLAAEQGVKVGRDGYYPAKFLEGDLLRDTFALADLVISRAGATTIAEIGANKKPAILVPLEGSANDHQRLNAYEVAKAGGALVLEETNLGEHILFEKIEKLLFDDALCAEMAEKMALFHHPSATEIIANAVIELGTL